MKCTACAGSDGGCKWCNEEKRIVFEMHTDWEMHLLIQAQENNKGRLRRAEQRVELLEVKVFKLELERAARYPA